MGIRYAAKPESERRNRELEATGTETWSQCLEIVYETDPEIIATVLPRPLTPHAKPYVRLNLTQVVMPGNLRFGAGWFGVHAMHGDQEGEYPLFMPMTTEQATVGGREVFGEPKKIAELSIERDGDRVSGSVGRMGFTLAEITGTIIGSRPPVERDSCDFYFKISPSPEDKGILDSDPLLVHSYKHHKERNVDLLDAELILEDSPLDPIADLPVLRIVDAVWSERASVINAKVMGTVPRADIEPFIHQRYDDMSVLGSKD
jgi:acetoacetate decarboxylase